MEHRVKVPRERNLVLIGARASGKTVVGQALARLLDRPFVDLDQVLVAEAGRSIAEIVAEEGWPGFRRREKELVARYTRRPGQVLAPGGGAVLDPDNVALLREYGVVIWLTAAPEVLISRLKQDPESQAFRPSLTGADPAAEMAQVLAEREPRYRAAAHLVVDTTGMSVSQVVESILEMLQGEVPQTPGGK
uniref:Shikimate kinase n=1 Tax=Desulfobacca acetoxidans TaxID=60893 RepID=A0A7C5ALQ0_9BACT